jgi:pimeloyl-ACP methyl ester carboxylesterase
MATFVLIPGAGTDPRVYRATIAALREFGHEGIAPELPLEDPEAGPSDHAAAVATAAPEGEELVVVGQSLGAFTAPIAAERLGAVGLILLAPMIPRPGETAGEWWMNTGHAEAIADLTERFGPPSEWGQEAMEYVFYADVDPKALEENERFDGPPAEGMFTEPWPLGAWPEVPTAVLAPREDRLFPLSFQRAVCADRLGKEPEEMPGGHLPMLARPRELAARLAELA